MINLFGVENFVSIGDGVWNSFADNINGAFDIQITRSLGDTLDMFIFKVQNNRNIEVNNFHMQDNINLHYLINGDAITSSNLIINGLTKKVTEDVNNKGKFLKIEGVSFGEVTTQALVFAEGNNVDVMQFLESALNSVRLRNGNFGITWNDDNPSIKSNDDPFPKINNGGLVKEFDKSFNKILEKYLQDEYTADGRHYWFINNLKELVIRRRDDAVIGGLVEGVDFKTASYKINSDDVRNFIIVKCGRDSYEKRITAKYDDPVSRAKHGFKYFMIIDDKIAGDLLVEQSFAENTKFPSIYPYNTTWGVSVGNDGDWNDEFRAEVKRRGSKRGNDFAIAHNDGFRQIVVVMKPTLTYDVGNKLGITSPSYNLEDFPMRIKDITFTIRDVTLTLIEEVALI